MKTIRDLTTKFLGAVLCAALISTSFTTVAAEAAAPILTVKSSEKAPSSDQGQAVSNLRIINLEPPTGGQGFDTVATVMTDQKLFWQIPVIWMDEQGNIASAYQPGKTYFPVFAFYIPSGVKVETDVNLGGYTIKLPEFLEGVYDSDDLVMVADPGNNLTFILSGTFVASLSEKGQGNISVIIAEKNSDGSLLKTPAGQNVQDFDSFIRNMQSRMESEKEESSGENGSGSVTYVDQVLIHCSKKVIERFGYENMARLMKLVRDEIAPKTVSIIKESLPALAEASDIGHLGETMGLYLYSSLAVDNPVLDGDAVAYVGASAEDVGDKVLDFKYIMGVNAEYVYVQNSENEYVIDELSKSNLENTIVHEMMHAFMYDYNRTGIVRFDNLDQDNIFPLWFVEGTASSVENVYTYRWGAFQFFRYDKDNKVLRDQFDENMLSNYLQDEDLWIARDNQSDFANYTTSYIACLYLYYLARDYNENVVDPDGNHEPLMTTGEDGSTIYNNKAFLEGFNYIIKELNEGSPLNEIVSEISGGRYSDLADFESKFLKGDGEGNPGGSLTFSIDYLNCLLDIERSHEYLYANGSLLLPLDTNKGSAIEDYDSYDHVNYDMHNNNTIVESTVPNEVAFGSAGVYTTGENCYISGGVVGGIAAKTVNEEAFITTEDAGETTTETATDAAPEAAAEEVSETVTDAAPEAAAEEATETAPEAADNASTETALEEVTDTEEADTAPAAEPATEELP